MIGRKLRGVSGFLVAIWLWGCGAPDEQAIGVISSALSPPHTAIGIATGTGHSCALLDNGQIKCWGGAWSGQLGTGSVANKGDQAGQLGNALGYVDLGGQFSATAVVAGDEHTCALLDDGKVKCWGANDFGQLGLGNAVYRGDNAGEMGNSLPTVNLGTGRTAKQLAAGGWHTCAILDNNNVKCWGKNTYGQLGLGDANHRGDGAGEMGDSLPAVNLGSGRTAKQIAAGWGHTCAVLDNNTLKCWGGNGYGQLGQGKQDLLGNDPGEMAALAAISLGTGRTVRSVAGGSAHTCAVLDNYAVKCWGRNDYGQLGLGDTVNRGDNAGEMGDSLPAVALGTGRTGRIVGAGEYHSCAKLDNNTVKCWGKSSFGELGLGDTTTRGDGLNEMGTALPAVSLGSGRTVKLLSTRMFHTCAILDNDQVKCWGWNPYGGLGLGDVNTRGDGPSEMGDSLAQVQLGNGLLGSKFFKPHPRAISVMQGNVYDVNDPAWHVGMNQNKDVFAYKVFAGLHMLGYNTDFENSANEAVTVLNQFQAQYGFTVESVLRPAVLGKLDELIAAKEPTFATRAAQFLPYSHMQPLARNDVSKDFVATLYNYPMTKLPASLQMGLDETVQCLAGQCFGDILNAQGNPWPTVPVNINQDYRFVGESYSPWKSFDVLYPAAVGVQTVLHEFGHHIDGVNNDPFLHRGIIETWDFYNIAYDMSTYVGQCAAPRSQNILDWISRYGYGGALVCPAGKKDPIEDWAESFAIYVTAGQRFRSAAAQRPLLAARYNWIKNNVFAGVEFNTDLQSGLQAGCFDAPPGQSTQPGYLSCSETAVWNGELPTL